MLVPICVCVVIWDGCYAKLTNINSRHHNIECFKIFTFSQGQILVQSRNIIQHLTRLGTCILWIWHLVYNPPNLTPQFAFLNFNNSGCLLRIWPLIWVRIKVKQLNKIQGKNQLTISLLKNKSIGNPSQSFIYPKQTSKKSYRRSLWTSVRFPSAFALRRGFLGGPTSTTLSRISYFIPCLIII